MFNRYVYDWKERLNTQVSRRLFELMMDAGGEMQTIVSSVECLTEEQCSEAIKIIEEEKIADSNEMIMLASDIHERDNPELYEILKEEYI
jgi:hypothetical protein